MVPKITKGASAYGSLSYDHGPGRRDEHENPHKVAGNVAGKNWRERAQAMDEHAARIRPDVARPIHRTALRLSPEDRALTDKEWRQVAERYVKRMGFEGCPWEATRHADDHIHLTVSRVRWDGTLARDSHDFAKAQKACREIESTHRLVNAAERYRRSEPEITRKEKDSAQRRGVVPEREQLREKVRAAEAHAGGSRERFEAALSEQGVSFRANIASTGRVSGYSYGLDGHRDRAGEPVFYKGSQLGKDYSWARSSKRMGLDQKERSRPEPRPSTREQAREAVEKAVQERTSGQRPDKQRPEHVRAEGENAARVDQGSTTPRGRTHNAQAHRKEHTRMDEVRPEVKQSGAASAMTRAEAAAKVAKQIQERHEKAEAERESAARAQEKGRER